MKTLDKFKFVKTVFVGGCKEQLKQSWVIGTAAGIGLSQGLKYNGSIKRGLIGSAATVAVLCTANGIYNVVTFWDKIKEVTKKEE